MAVDSLGPKGNPVFNDGNGFDLGADETAVALYASRVGNRFADTSANRSNFATAFAFNPWEGLEFYEQDTGITYRWTNSAWKAWSSYWTQFYPGASGSISNMAPGTGGSAASGFFWRYVDGEVRVQGALTLGTSSSGVYGQIAIPLPVNADTRMVRLPGFAYYVDNGNAAYDGFVALSGASTVYLLGWKSASGSDDFQAPTSSTYPFTWGPGDYLNVDFTYKPA